MKLHRYILPLLVIISLLLGACSSPTPAATDVLPSVTPVPSSMPEPSQTPEPTATSAPTETPGPTDEVWARINKNHKIIIGLSLDNPPFSDLGSFYKAEGLDVVLAQEIGKRLNLPVEIQNIAPQGLTGALQINQIDLALDGLPNTADPAGQLSFSQAYLADQTVLLARKLSTIKTITAFKQLAALRVGVEKGSVYEKLAQTYLVDAGVLNKRQVISYTYVDLAIRNLLANKVDVVMTGRSFAGYYSLTQPDLHVVGAGFAEQDLAVAMRANTPGLKAQVDRALGEMTSDGTLDGFIQQYIRGGSATADLPAAEPLSQIILTPSPTVTPASAAACIDGLKFLLDETNGATEMGDPPKGKTGKIFTQTWKVQNTGTCTWTPQYHLVYAYGNVDAAQMGGVPVRIQANVKPGEVADLAVEMIVPSEAATYQSFWQLENDQGQTFGQTLWVGVKAIKTKNQANNTPSQPKLKTCQVINTGPQHDPRIRDNFDVTWDVTNTSGMTWTVGAVSYVYVSGDKFQKQDTYNIPADLLSGATDTFAVDMNAPTTPGQYSTVWNVIWGKTILCTLVANFTVVPR